MNKLLTAIGYYNTNELSTKFTYIITAFSASLVLLYLTFYIFFVKSLFVNTVTLVCLSILLSVFYFLKTEKFFIAKTLMILGFFLQETALVFLWFTPDANFNYFYFIVAPITFFVLNFNDKKERAIIIITNIMALIFLLMSELLPITPYIIISKQMARLFSTLSVVSTLLSIIVVYYFYAKNLSVIHKELNKLANTDSLTKISNRRVLFSEGKDLFHLCKKYHKSMTLILIDIDHFKLINDQYGHPVGDQVLVEMTNLINDNIRVNDLFSRYGGEEFALILKDTNDSNHIDIAHNLKSKIESHTFVSKKQLNLHLTVSIGLVDFSDHITDFDHMVNSADKALYSAKENGRNQVVIANK